MAEDTRFLDWIIKEKAGLDKQEALQNGGTPENWIPAAKIARDREWNEMLDSMTPVSLWEEGAPNFDETYGQRQPSVIAYPEQNTGEPRGAVLISAGGGYIYKSVWEAEPMARRFYEAGFQTFIVNYRVQPYTRDDSAADALRSVRFVRYYAERFNIKPDKIAVLGGSAGARQSAIAATRFDFGNPDAADPVERVPSRPDAIIMNYGAMTEVGHLMQVGAFSFEKQNTLSEYSTDMNLRSDCPPFFVWQTVADDPRLSCGLGMMLTHMGIPFEMHIFPEGPHGGGLYDGGHRFAPYYRSTTRWSQMAVEFLENLGF